MNNFDINSLLCCSSKNAQQPADGRRATEPLPNLTPIAAQQEVQPEYKIPDEIQPLPVFEPAKNEKEKETPAPQLTEEEIKLTKEQEYAAMRSKNL